MLKIRKSGDRGYANHGWLDTYHTFSFADYYDPEFAGFRDLLVINEDKISAGQGFGTHGHRDMEIITYVLSGELEHRDSMGTGSVLRRGDVQRMSAGTGVRHSEFNHSKTQGLHLFQIWIRPREAGIKPGYEERNFSAEQKHNRLCCIASPDSSEGALKIHQDVSIFASILDSGKSVSHSIASKRHVWIQMASGSIVVNGITLESSDGLAISDETELKITAQTPAEFLIFDLI